MALLVSNHLKASHSLDGCIMRTTTSAIAIRASRSEKLTSLRTPGKPSTARDASARRSEPAERASSISTLSSLMCAVLPSSDSSAGFSNSRLRNLCTMLSAAAANSGAGSKRNSFPASFASMISTSSAHWALGIEKLAPRLRSVFCCTLLPTLRLSTRRTDRLVLLAVRRVSVSRIVTSVCQKTPRQSPTSRRILILLLIGHYTYWRYSRLVSTNSRPDPLRSAISALFDLRWEYPLVPAIRGLQKAVRFRLPQAARRCCSRAC